MFKRRTTPANCALSKINTQEGRTAFTTQDVVQMDRSDIYQQVLTLFQGKTSGVIGQPAYAEGVPSNVRASDNFDAVYRKMGGTWTTTPQKVGGELIYAASIGCRREAELLKEKGKNGDVWYNSEEDAIHNLSLLATSRAGRAICDTCPYRGMDPAQADEYDARANRAEAERLESERIVSIARNKLNAHLHEIGLQTNLELQTGDESADLAP